MQIQSALSTISAKIRTKTCLPDFMIIGAQKCGTSALHYYLSQHPQLIGSTPKEVHYFDKPKERRKSLQWYVAHFQKPRFMKSLSFESTPNYIYHRHVPGDLSNLGKDFKFILLLRNPVDRAFSAWNMYKDFFEEDHGKKLLKENPNSGIYATLFKDRGQFPSFEEAIDIELKLIANGATPEPALLRRGLYSEQILNFLDYFDISSFCIIDSSELKKYTAKILNDIASFLGVTSFDSLDMDVKQKHARKYSAIMSGETRLRLEEFYSTPNAELFELIGKTFDW
jgi:hypothetical protein